MKCAVMLLLTCTRLLLAGWEYVELPSEIEYINQDIVQGLSSYYIWVVAYDNENSEALILRSYWGWPSWERYTTPFDQDYVYTDIVGDWVVPNPHAIVVGYKKGEPEKHKGIILRGNGAGFDDITCNVPDSLPCRQSPTPFLSVARYPDAPLDDKVIVTGGFGTILISNDNGDTWSYVASHPNADPEARLSDWYYSSDWSAAYYPRPFVVCGDNTGLVAWTYDDGVNWHAKDFPYSEGYQIPGLQNPYAGNLTPLHVQDSACGMSFGYVAVGIPDWRSGQISFDNTGTPQKWWWWHGAACWRYGLPWETTYAHWFVGADGGILRCDSAIFDVPHCKWEHQPENDSFYTLNTIDFGVTDDLYSWYFHGHALGSKGRNLYAQFGFLPPGNVDYPPAPNVQAAPRRPQNFTMVYDAIYGGYRMYWDPPANHDSAKVGGYWICPPEDDGEIGFIANKVPIPRTTYFLSWPIGSYLIAGACPMRRDGLSGDWSNFEWRCTIDKLVDDGATGRNNAGRLLYGGSTAWSFWSKDGEIHVACSADSGKHWTYRPAQAALGSGYWPAAALDNNHNPAVCWVENIVNGSQVTARIHYCRHDGREWSSSYIIREETFTGAGYLYPSVSVSENNHVHIIYGKVYDDYQNWQLWYGEFPLDDPDAVEWYALDYQSGRPEALGKLVPTIGTDRYSQPMVVWNRPNSDALYFAYRDGQGAWHTRTLGFTGTSPCLEVKGVTAYLVYENSTDIWYATGGTGGFGTPTRIANSAGASAAPVIANNIIVWEEHLDGDYEIYYSYLRDDLKWTPPERLFGYPYLPDRMPQIAWAYPFAFVAWTQGDGHKVVAFNRMEITSEEGDGPPSLAYNLGDSMPAPILAERSGYVQYGTEPAEMVDVGTNTLRYQLTGLDDEFTWKGRLLFYHESNHSISCRIVLNNAQPIIVTIPPHYVMTRTCNIPASLILNEALDIVIEPLNGNELALGGLLLYSRPVQTGGGPQSYSEQNTTALNLQCAPAIFNKTTEISYVLSRETDVQLVVYNALGQLVAVVDQGCRSGDQSLRWLPRDMRGRRLASGIYFLQLKTDDAIAVRKMVIVE